MGGKSLKRKDKGRTGGIDLVEPGCRLKSALKLCLWQTKHRCLYISSSFSLTTCISEPFCQRLNQNIFPARLLYSFISHSLRLSSPSSWVHILSSLWRILRCMLGVLTYVSVCVCEQLIVCLCCVCVCSVHLRVFLDLPRLGIKRQSRGLMFSLIERHHRSESIAAHRWDKKDTLQRNISNIQFRCRSRCGKGSSAGVLGDTLSYSFSIYLTRIEMCWLILNIGWASMR